MFNKAHVQLAQLAGMVEMVLRHKLHVQSAYSESSKAILGRIGVRLVLREVYAGRLVLASIRVPVMAPRARQYVP